jgi:hypothetical protein
MSIVFIRAMNTVALTIAPLCSLSRELLLRLPLCGKCEYSPKRTLLAVLLIIASSTASSGVFLHAQQQYNAEEEALEALYLWQFLQYIEWPPLAHGQEGFVVGIMGNTKVAAFFDEQARKKTLPDGGVITVKRISSPDEAEKCRALYIAPTVDAAKVSQLLTRLRNKPTLTVGHDERFIERGGIINFYNENDRLRFEINVNEATNSKLKLSARLLRLGKLASRQ